MFFNYPIHVQVRVPIYIYIYGRMGEEGVEECGRVLYVYKILKTFNCNRAT